MNKYPTYSIEYDLKINLQHNAQAHNNNNNEEKENDGIHVWLKWCCTRNTIGAYVLVAVLHTVDVRCVFFCLLQLISAIILYLSHFWDALKFKHIFVVLSSL